jgi:signal transduction histidine kinase
MEVADEGRARVRPSCAARFALVAAAIAVLGMLVAGVAVANNLDHRTAVSAARQVAKQDCRATNGCRHYFVRGMHKVTQHKAVGKIATLSVKNGERFLCTRQIVIRLDRITGEITYAVSKRRCREVGPA